MDASLSACQTCSSELGRLEAIHEFNVVISIKMVHSNMKIMFIICRKGAFECIFKEKNNIEITGKERQKDR